MPKAADSLLTDSDFQELLGNLLQTMSRTAAERGFFLVAADLRALRNRTESYFRSLQQRAGKAEDERAECRFEHLPLETGIC